MRFKQNRIRIHLYVYVN